MKCREIILKFETLITFEKNGPRQILLNKNFVGSFQTCIRIFK